MKSGSLFCKELYREISTINKTGTLQSANAQSQNTTQFQMTTVSIYLDENYTITELTNTTMVSNIETISIDFTFI